MFERLNRPDFYLVSTVLVPAHSFYADCNCFLAFGTVVFLAVAAQEMNSPEM